MGYLGGAGLVGQIRRLHEDGSFTGLTDAELLGRFAARRGLRSDAAEAAFEVLVARHGPMVLGTCRRMLGEADGADDAFQATFLVLLRRARSVRVGGSLGPWLHGVAVRVARKARERSLRSRAHLAPLSCEPSARGEGADRRELLAALDEELGRLPAKYRTPIVLCHLEGLSHAEAADRLGWPVGTLSGRLSRARGLLGDRLRRRGVGPADLLATIPRPVAMPDGLARAAASLAAGVGAEGPAAASVLSLATGMSGLAARPASTWGAALVLASACAAAVVSATGGWAPSASRAGEPSRSATAGTKSTAQLVASAEHYRPAQEIVDEIEERLRVGRDSKEFAAFQAAHGEAATRRRLYEEVPGLILELRTAYPDDPRGARFMIDRWRLLTWAGRTAEALDETAAILDTSIDPRLVKDARVWNVGLRLKGSIDGPDAATLARECARKLGDDPRAAGLLHQAAGKLGGNAWTRLGLIATLAIATAGILAARRWGRWMFLAGAASLAAALLALAFVRLFADEGLREMVEGWHRWINDPERLDFFGFVVAYYGSLVAAELTHFTTSVRGWAAFATALASAALAVFALRKRSEAGPSFGTSVGWAVLAGVGGLVGALAVDAGLLELERRSLRRQVLRDYPESARGRLIQGESRRSRAVGGPFELEFDDAITGRRVAMKDLRGKVVVVDFWATWCGPCVAEVPEMLRLYGAYRDRGVEFLGVSLDKPEEDGGLRDLREFVAERKIPWPQHHQGRGFEAFASGEAAGSFSESWGVDMIPTVFVIDAEGRLHSTDARGKLDDIIPRLLAERDAP